MVLLRYLLVFGGIMLLVGAVAILIMDVYQILKFRKDPDKGTPPPPRWHAAMTLGACAVAPLLARPEHRGGAQRIGGGADQSIRGNPPGNSLSGCALDFSSDRRNRTLRYPRWHVHHAGGRRSEEREKQRSAYKRGKD